MKRKDLQFNQDESVIKQLRTRMNMTQQAFAVALGVSVTTVARWERGERNPMFTIEQVKNLDLMLKTIGLQIKDLPDDMAV